MEEIRTIERKIFTTFADVASSLGYSPLHGQIIAVLLVRDKALSLQEVARETGYSTSMVSLALDLLEVLGVVKKVKVAADRRLYVELSGDLLETLKSAILMKLGKSITSSLGEFSDAKKRLEGLHGEEAKRVIKTVETLEHQIKRLKMYTDLLASAKLP